MDEYKPNEFEIGMRELMDKSFDGIGDRLDDFESNSELNTSFGPNGGQILNCVPKIHLNINNRKLIRKVTTRVNKWGHSFNNLVGFTKDDFDFPDSTGTLDTDTRRRTIIKAQDRLAKRKKFVMTFITVCTMLGFLLFITGLFLRNMETVEILKNSTSDINQEHDLTIVLGQWKFNIIGLIELVWIIGLAIIVTSLCGLFCTYGGIYRGMALYSSFMMIFVATVIFLAAYSKGNEESIRNHMRNNFRRMWVIGGIEGYSSKLERKFGCCGFYNVFDYCADSEMESIISDYLDAEAIADISYESAVPNRGFTPQFDYYENDFSNSDESLYDSSFCNPDYDEYCESSTVNPRSRKSVEPFYEKIIDPAITINFPINYANEQYCTSDGDEHCVCGILSSKSMEQPYMTSPCFTNTKKEKIAINEVCPRFDMNKRKICHLNGCGDLLDDYFMSYFLIPLCLLGGTMMVVFFMALVFILQITHNFRNSSFREDLRKIRRTIEKIYVNCRQFFYDLTMENCSAFRRTNRLNISTDHLDFQNKDFDDTLTRSPFVIQKKLSNEHKNLPTKPFHPKYYRT